MRSGGGCGFPSVIARRIRIVGLVQGVGFRPFIYRIAAKAGVKGYVLNLGGSEVLVHAEAPPENIGLFLELLRREKPPPAIIEDLEIEDARVEGYKSFTIRKSGAKVTVRSQIPPDLGICDDCLREILDPNNRRYRYPWNSCAWCGPRYSMMYRIPYDRENTSMRDFPLCEQCRREYEDPSNTRRFHAQGISCQNCGPHTILRDGRGNPLPVSDPIMVAAEHLNRGAVIAVRGVGGYHIAGSPFIEETVRRIRHIKQRPQQPLALMAYDCDAARGIADVSEADCEVLRSPQRPILLVKSRDPHGSLQDLIAPGLDSLGIMLPYTGLQALLLRSVEGRVLIMTSGNRHGLPMCKDLDCILDQFEGDIDYILDHNRVIVHRVDDSVLRRTLGQPVLLRRSRGYAPLWVRVSHNVGEHVALGAELQTAGAISFDDKIVPTQYIGDLDEPGQLEELGSELEWLIEQYRLNPESVAVDAHPGYSNRRLAPLFAEKYGSQIVEVYHHHAHALSLIADAGLNPLEPHPAVTVDGTGYGVDGQIWGGEALIVEGLRFERAASISYYPLPGGDTAAKRPLRVLIGILSLEHSLEEILDLLARIGALGNDISMREAVIAYKISSSAPRTSSTGRLLDAISALLGVSRRRTYEGEPAIKLEAQARLSGARGRAIEDIIVSDYSIDPLRAVHHVYTGLIERGVRGGLEAAADVMFTIGYQLASAALARTRSDLLFTGGAAVNDYIAAGARAACGEYGVRLIMHRRLPPGDGGISAGQILYAGLYSKL